MCFMRTSASGSYFSGIQTTSTHPPTTTTTPPLSSLFFPRTVHYEGGAVSIHARSLWRLETLRVAWSGSHTRWGQPFRLRHVTTGKYLSIMEDKGLLLMDKEKADVKSTAFCFRPSKEKLDLGPKKEVDGMGAPDIKYGDSVCYIQHVDTCLWLTYQAMDAKCARMGGVQRKVRYITV
eukprot:XP_014040256.1 PREDICTED: ryanodine receptor 2-like [Salmo salar]